MYDVCLVDLLLMVDLIDILLCNVCLSIFELMIRGLDPEFFILADVVQASFVHDVSSAGTESLPH